MKKFIARRSPTLRLTTNNFTPYETLSLQLVTPQLSNSPPHDYQLYHLRDLNSPTRDSLTVQLSSSRVSTLSLTRPISYTSIDVKSIFSMREYLLCIYIDTTKVSGKKSKKVQFPSRMCEILV